MDDVNAQVSVGAQAAARPSPHTWSGPAGLADGSNTLEIKAVDPAGNVSTIQFHAALDTVAPQIENHRSGRGKNHGRRNDRGAGNRFGDRNFGQFERYFRRSGGNKGFSVGGIALAAGRNVLRAEAQDAAKNRGVFERIIERESAIVEAPVLDALASPTREESVEIAGSAPSGAVKVAISGGVAEVQAEAANGRFQATVYLEVNRLNILCAQGVSAAGRRGPCAQAQIRQDETPPVLEWVSPVNGAILPPGEIPVFIHCTDDFGLSRAYIQDQVVSLDASGMGSARLALSAGQNALTARAIDLAGNEQTQNIAVEVSSESTDSQPPVLTFLHPRDGDWTALNPIGVQASILDQSAIASIRVQGIERPPEELQRGILETTVTLERGLNTILLEASDAGGLGAQKQIQVHYEPDAPEPPAVSAIAPASPAKASSVAVRGTYADRDGFRVRIQGGAETAEATVSAGQWRLDIVLNPNTMNHLRITGISPAGPESEAVLREVLHDSIAPEVQEAYPAPGSEITLDAPLRLRFSEPIQASSLAAGISVRLIGGASIPGAITLVSATEAEWRGADLLPAGRIIEARAGTQISDLAGNPLIYVFSASYRTETPQALAQPVLDPPPPEWTSLSQISVAGSSLPGARITLLTPSSTLNADCDASGKFAFTVNLVPNRANVFSLTAQKGSQRSQALEWTVNQDSLPPQVVITPGNQEANVIPGTVIQFTFSEWIRAEDLPSSNSTEGTLSVVLDGTAPTGAFSLSADGKVASFTPEQPLPVSRTLTVSARPPIRDRAGNSLAASTSVQFQYFDGAVPPAPVIEAILPGNPTSQTLVQIQGRTLPGATAETLDGRGLQTDTPSNPEGRFTLSVQLTANQLNVFQVSARNRSGVGGPSTTIQITHDGRAPQIVSILPSGQGVDASGISVSVAFSEAMSPSSIQKPGFIVVEEEGAGIASAGMPTLSEGGSAIALSLPTLKYDTSYHITVSGEGRDLAGNRLVSGEPALSGRPRVRLRWVQRRQP